MAHDQEASGAGTAGAPRRTGFRALAATGAVCALVAVVLAVVADDPRWLRLGVVAGLWAALSVLALSCGRLTADRGDGAQEGEADALRRAYEAELAREVEARREFELTLENDLRRQFEVERGTELERLRHEVERLGHALEARAGEPREATRRWDGAPGPAASVPPARGPGGVDVEQATRVLARGNGAAGQPGDAAPGAPANGHGPNGHGPNGYGPNGHGPNGYGPNGQGPNGYPTTARPAPAGGPPGPTPAVGARPTDNLAADAHPGDEPPVPAGATRVGGRTVAELVAAYGSPAEPRTTRPPEPAITANRRRGDRAVP